MKRFGLALALLAVFAHQSYAVSVVLDNVPRYTWWYGCTPTAAGSLMAYWDSQPGFENMYKKGDAQIYNGDGTWGTRRMVASQRHINGLDDPPDSIAGFMGTSLAGATSQLNIPIGMKNFAEWDDTSTYDMKDGYPAITTQHRMGGFPGMPGSDNISFDLVKSEIDAGRPVILSLRAMSGQDIMGHSVVCYGYDDDITFGVFDGMIGETMTLPGFAVMDTWTLGSGNQSRWYDWDEDGNKINVEEIFDSRGNEWWPYFPEDMPGGAFFSGDYDWRVNGFTTFELVPEPATFLLFSVGILCLRKRRSS